MTVTALSLGGTTLAQPDVNGISIEEVPIATATRMLNGTLRVQYRTTKRRVTLAWQGLSASEKSTLSSAWLAAFLAAKTLILPNAVSLSVLAAASPWSENQWYSYNGTPYYDVTLIFEEA